MKPDYVQAQLQLALSYESKGDLWKAIQELESSASGYGNTNADVFFNLGRLYYNNKNFDKAEGIFLELLKINPDNANVLYSLASVYEARGELEKALEKYKKVSVLNEKNENNSTVLKKIDEIKKQIESKVNKNQTVEENKVEAPIKNEGTGSGENAQSGTDSSQE